jgi:hypothetical protein
MNHSSVKPRNVKLNSDGPPYNLPQQYEPLLCQTWTITVKLYISVFDRGVIHIVVVSYMVDHHC